MKIAVEKKGYTNMCLNGKKMFAKRDVIKDCNSQMFPNPNVWTLNITKINPKYRQKLAFH
jgi:hypothetical protein